MIKKNTKSMRICMCCGERKEIEDGSSYCRECSTPSLGSGILLQQSDNGKNAYSSSCTKVIL